MKQKSLFLALMFSCLCCGTACADSPQRTTETSQEQPETTVMQTTTPVPATFFQPAIQSGRVELLRYTSKDYTRADQPATQKPAYVYLPYGYDESKEYDIIYLLHGWTGTAQEYFALDNWPQMRHLFDNLIARGLTKPFIAVSPTWDQDNQAKGWDESTQEAAVFSQEYVNDLIPAVESKYSTYAKSTDKAGILASRNHRAIGGFSLGAITTWYIFEQAFPYSRWYLPMSGDNWHVQMFGGQSRPRETADFLANLVKASPYKDDFYVWYAVGSEDSRLPQTHNQALAMAALSETFNRRNFSYHQKPGGRHDMNAVWEFCYNALPFFFPAKESEQSPDFTQESTVTDVMNAPIFQHYGRLLFPVDRNYWSGSRLGDLRLTWYTHINPNRTVEVVNDLKHRAEKGEQIFYDIYTEAEKEADPAKRNTGLFFLRGQQNAPFAICNAGGGFAFVGAMHDSFPHALELAKRGYNAFVLIYRPGSQTAVEDLARAIAFVQDHAQQLGVASTGYSLWGGSAGARMAAALGNRDILQQATGRSNLPQASAVVMQYTGYSSTSDADAPTYACVGTADGIAPWGVMRDRLLRLSEMGIATEFHAYDGLPHGFGLGDGTVAEGWIEDAIRFWESQRKPSRLSQVSKGTTKTDIRALDGTKRTSLQPGVNIVNGKKLLL